MRFWRICPRRYAAAALTGEGARLYSRRWNGWGVRVVYASTSLSLAAIETFVNLDPDFQPRDLASIEGALPDDLGLQRVEEAALPSNWRRKRHESLRRFGDEWIRANTTVALLVPSAPIVGEWNVLLNPLCHDFAKVRFQRPLPFALDPRMFRRG